MRRGLLALMLAATAVVAGCGSSGSGSGSGGNGARDATLMLDFTPNAVHAGIYSAIARGFDRAAGVHLHVVVPGASTDSVKLLLGARVDFAVLDVHDLALARERGADLVGVLALVQRPLAAVIAQPSIHSPRDLEGKRVGVTGLPSDDAVLRSVVSGDGGNPRKVHEVTIGFNAVGDLISGRVSAATAFWDVEGVTLQRRRPGMREFKVDEFGAPAYPELVVCVTGKTLRDDPKLVSAVVRAVAQGYAFTRADPGPSLHDLESATQGLDPSLLTAELHALEPAFAGPDGRFGELNPHHLAAWARWETRFGIVKHPPDIPATFDGRFVPH